jgi:putative ABC transport system ATP-binding protein
MAEHHSRRFGVGDVLGWIALILGPDARFLRLALVYGVGIALLALATPISVQLLINSVANTALPAPLLWLSGLLLAMLLFWALLSALRVHLMALLERRLFARVVAEVTMRAVHAQNPFFGDQRRTALFNRFFDMVTVQKAVPELLIGGFSIFLQMAVGLTITSFYSPFFLAFNAVLVLVTFLIWQVWAGPAIRTAIEVSHAKHDAAAWVESVGGSNGFYKSGRHLDFALDRSEAMIAGYVRAHKRHFRYSFRQTLAFLGLYAVASASLLALGGWLIIGGSLSIGQLVAAELILSGVFYGISQLGDYLDKFYDLSASLEELSLLYGIEQEEQHNRTNIGPRNGAIRLREVACGALRFDFAVGAGEQLAIVSEPDADHVLAELLKRHVHPDRGIVMAGGEDIENFDMFKLRSEIMVFERPQIVDVTIREYFRLSGREGASGVMDMLEVTGLAERIASLPMGLDTPLSASGRPLSVGETMAMKLTMALLAQPKVVMLGPLFDLLPPERLRAALRHLRSCGTTVLQVTRRPEEAHADGYLWLGRAEQTRVPSAAALNERAERTGRAFVPA